MNKANASGLQTAFALILAIIFQLILFRLQWVNFWGGMAVAATILTGLSFTFAGVPFRRNDISLRHCLAGALSAIALYVVFAGGNELARLLFPFAPQEIADIYALRRDAHPWVIVLILLFITSPAEELFWRGFIQRRAMQRRGDRNGWIVASLAYAGVHILSGNAVLVLAALTAGLFWGFLYQRTRSMSACIISHALCAICVFVLWALAAA